MAIGRDDAIGRASDLVEGSRDSLLIALVVPAFIPAVEYGGPISKVRALAWGLRELGHRPEVWCGDYGPGRTRVRSRGGVVDGTPVRYLRRLVSYRWSPVIPQAVLTSARSGVDIGHCFGMWDGLTVFAATGFRYAGIPYAVEPLGMYPPAMRSIGAKKVFQAALNGRYLQGSGVIIATSQREAEQIRLQAGRPVVVRSNPVFAPPTPPPAIDFRRTWGLAAGSAVLGWLGRVSRSKGLDVLVEALRLLPRVHLALAGPDDHDGAMETLLETIRRNGVTDRVHLLGPVWDQDKEAFLASIDVFVLPSVMENFGNAAVEAAVRGVPVVVSEGVGAAPWLAELGAAIVTPLTPVDVAAAIQSAIEARSTVEARSQLSATVVEAVSPIRVAAEQVAIYRRAINISENHGR